MYMGQGGRVCVSFCGVYLPHGTLLCLLFHMRLQVACTDNPQDKKLGSERGLTKGVVIIRFASLGLVLSVQRFFVYVVVAVTRGRHKVSEYWIDMCGTASQAKA